MAQAAVLFADPIPRAGMSLLLKSHPLIDDVQEFDSVESFFHEIERSHDFGLCIMTLDLPGMGSLEALAELKRLHPSIPALVVTRWPASLVAVRCLQAGALGFITQSQEPQELFDAIELVLRGQSAVGALHIDLIIKAISQPESQLPHARLSNREFEIMRRIAAGDSLQSIADDLFISAKTVSTHRRRIMDKLNFQSNAQLTQYALENSILDSVI
ncbi:CitB Response regulator containing a CheY-like receiver domain and an HTH DNA-binding domain [Acidimicrobiia bacterium]